jgi:peptidoglycan/LPS O-acetylase OafA/YrhL
VDAFDVQKVAYRWMRRTIGLLGMALPITLAGVCHESGDCRPATSISGYYHTDMRFLFVTILVLLAVLLFAYPGYDEDDDFAGHLAGAFTMGVVIFPINAGGTPMGPSAWAHVICAAAMFLLLAVFCLFLFRRTEADRKPHGRAPSALAGARGFLKPPTKAPQPGSRKHARNTLFLICGIVIVGCVIGLLVSFVETRRGGHTSDLVWWCETIALFAFGLAWIVKGDMIMADEPAPASPVTGR